MGLVVFMEDVLANDSMASIDTRSMDGRIYVSDHNTYIYKPFQRKRFLSFSHYKSIHMPVSPKNHMPLPYLMMLYM